MENTKVMADLALQLTAETAQFKKGLTEANKNINKHGKQTQNIGKKVAGAWAPKERSTHLFTTTML
jgi:hypothetical protein